jgi:hypothetical protein
MGKVNKAVTVWKSQLSGPKINVVMIFGEATLPRVETKV